MNGMTRMMRKRWSSSLLIPGGLAVLPLLAITAADAGAQGTVVFRGRAEGAGPAGDVLFTTPVLAGRIGVIAVEPLETGRPVKGAPYTADAITETEQVLADGNRIGHRSSASIARDSKGRVRREHQSMPLGGFVAPDGPALTTIVDPSTGLHITLDHERRTAHVVMAGQPFELPVPPPSAGVPVAGTVFYRADAMQAGVMPSGAVPSGAVPIGAVPSGTVLSGAAKTSVETTKLGDRMIDGVRAEGTRTTIVIPAGAAGNQLPIEIVSERWYSPDLQVVLQTDRSDPRFGDTTYRLTNILRVEPPIELFEVPPGFRIQK
jgi:hypothetical protein